MKSNMISAVSVATGNGYGWGVMTGKAIGAHTHIVALRYSKLQEVEWAHGHLFALRPAQILNRDLALKLARFLVERGRRSSVQADLVGDCKGYFGHRSAQSIYDSPSGRPIYDLRCRLREGNRKS